MNKKSYFLFNSEGRNKIYYFRKIIELMENGELVVTFLKKWTKCSVYSEGLFHKKRGKIFYRRYLRPCQPQNGIFSSI